MVIQERLRKKFLKIFSLKNNKICRFRNLREIALDKTILIMI